jgi:hypothetical protein
MLPGYTENEIVVLAHRPALESTLRSIGFFADFTVGGMLFHGSFKKIYNASYILEHAVASLLIPLLRSIHLRAASLVALK